MTPKKHILIVEDNEHLAHINSRALEMAGYRVSVARTLGEARTQLAAKTPDAIVLDILLPDGNGVDFCREIRQAQAAPILFLTSVAGHKQAMEGMSAGGDDYLNKPFDIDMLVAKIQAFFRRDDITGRMRAHKSLVCGSLELDMVAHQAFLNGGDMGLAPKEFALLVLLVQKKGATLSRETLYESVWKRPMGSDANALKNAIYRLRQKTEGSGCLIETQWGTGYRLEIVD